MKAMLFRAMAFTTALLLLVGCSGPSLPPQTASTTQESSSAVAYPAEFPAATDPLPTDPPAGPLASVAPSQEPQTSQVPAAESEANTLIVTPQEPSASSALSAARKDQEEETIVLESSIPEEVRGIWISYLEFATLAKNQTEAQFEANMDRVFANVSNYGLNTVFLQVRPFGDAMYASDYFPYSYILTGTEGGNPGYDPLAVMVESARSHNLRIEAWINPYRVRAIGSTRALAASNPALLALNRGEDTAIQYQGGVFYNPSSKKARDLITNGVIELCENYDIDGIHFDDYFYPTTDMAFDAAYYNAYVKAGGKLSQADWRRYNVDLLVAQVYAAIKTVDQSLIFGISPQARMDNNYHGQFIDVQKWLSTPGYIDYICPQIYFGFENKTVPFANSLAEWNQMTKDSHVSLYTGLAVYKCGTVDKWAGEGINEWQQNSDLMLRMVKASRGAANYGGFALYRYDSLFAPESAVKATVDRERANLSSIL